MDEHTGDWLGDYFGGSRYLFFFALRERSPQPWDCTGMEVYWAISRVGLFFLLHTKPPAEATDLVPPSNKVKHIDHFLSVFTICLVSKSILSGRGWWWLIWVEVSMGWDWDRGRWVCLYLSYSSWDNNSITWRISGVPMVSTYWSLWVSIGLLLDQKWRGITARKMRIYLGDLWSQTWLV